MAYCGICGDENGLTAPKRVWSPDDGWQIVRLCSGCNADHGTRKPRPDDYAYDKRGEFVSDDDSAIDVLFG